MNILHRDLTIIILSILAVITGLFLENTFIGLLISILLGIVAFMNKRVGFLLLLIFTPVRPFLITLNPGFKAIADLIIFLILMRVIYDNRKDWKSLFSFQPLELAFFAFCIVGIISALGTGVEPMAIIAQLRTYLLFYFIYYILKRVDLKESSVKLFAITTLFMALIISLHGLVEKITNKTILLPEVWENAYWWLSPTNYIRVYGLLKGPNELSLYLIITFFISLYLLKNTDGKLKYLVYFGLTIISTTFFLTYSRGALLGLAVFLLIHLLIQRNIKQLLPLAIVIVISLGLFTGISKISDYHYETYVDPSAYPGETNPDGTPIDDVGHGKQRFKETFSNEFVELSATTGRLYYVKKSVQIFKDNPITGTGFATFGGAATLAYSSPIYEKYDINRNFYSDNQYILALTETGIIGIIFLSIFALSIVKITWKTRKGYVFSPLLLYLVTALIISGAVYNILENDTFMMYFYFILGYAYHKLRQEKVQI